jgi:hypothetical protein
LLILILECEGQRRSDPIRQNFIGVTRPASLAGRMYLCHIGSVRWRTTIRIQPINYRGFSIEQETDGSFSLYGIGGYIRGSFPNRRSSQSRRRLEELEE